FSVARWIGCGLWVQSRASPALYWVNEGNRPVSTPTLRLHSIADTVSLLATVYDTLPTAVDRPAALVCRDVLLPYVRGNGSCSSASPFASEGRDCDEEAELCTRRNNQTRDSDYQYQQI